MIQRLKDDTRKCVEIAQEAYATGQTEEAVLGRLVDVLAKHSAEAREDLQAWPYFGSTLVEGYRQYFSQRK